MCFRNWKESRNEIGHGLSHTKGKIPLIEFHNVYLCNTLRILIIREAVTFSKTVVKKCLRPMQIYFKSVCPSARLVGAGRGRLLDQSKHAKNDSKCRRMYFKLISAKLEIPLKFDIF